MRNGAETPRLLVTKLVIEICRHKHYKTLLQSPTSVHFRQWVSKNQITQQLCIALTQLYSSIQMSTHQETTCSVCLMREVLTRRNNANIIMGLFDRVS